MPDPVDDAIRAELPLACEVVDCGLTGRWTIERVPGEFRELCDRHYAQWPVEGAMFTRTRLATAWGWPKPELVEEEA